MRRGSVEGFSYRRILAAFWKPSVRLPVVGEAPFAPHGSGEKFSKSAHDARHTENFDSQKGVPPVSGAVRVPAEERVPHGQTQDEHDHRHISARPHDVEDFAQMVITFSDGTKTSVLATDTALGGTRNAVDVYCSAGQAWVPECEGLTGTLESMEEK